AYESTLKSIGVLVKARNFLVFQGDVESIAQKAPKDLTALFEQISGSEDLKASYEEARRAKEEADENVIFAYQKKKSQAAERKQVKEQKEEAERYAAKKSELSALTTEAYLHRLYHVKRELDQNEAKLSVVRSEFSQALEQEQSLESTIQAEKAEAAVLQRDVGKAEKEQAKRRERLEALAPGKIKEEQGLKARQEKLKAEKEAGMSMREDLLQQKERKKGLAEDIAKLEATEQELQIKQAEAMEEMRASGVTLSEAKLQEYNKLKQQVSAQCQEGKARLQALVRQQEADKTEAAVQERELSLHLATKESAARDIEQQSAKTQQLSADLQKRAKESEQLEKDIARMEQEGREAEERLVEVRAEMKGLEDQQRAYRQERKQSQHEEKMAAALEIMKDMYPGVKGRLVDLCRPSSRKFNQAVAVAGGRLMDAIVTDTKQTASECIRHLREQRVGVADFIPLSGIKDKSPNERYRALGEAFRLAVDVIECEDEIRGTQYRHLRLAG
ncbi:structural maintenance of chromosome-like protein, partial [Nannochloropsis gaditana CCMP526]|uniref:structural maintenance of chromosome-like protein n=1 Tax=Nannochloropsis gaditana (strain CCMP526) TaxID=1093141 RepID=UPI00029F5A9E